MSSKCFFPGAVKTRNRLGKDCPAEFNLLTVSKTEFNLSTAFAGLCLTEIMIQQAVSAEEDQTARMCRLILIYTHCKLFNSCERLVNGLRIKLFFFDSILKRAVGNVGHDRYRREQKVLTISMEI